MAFCGLENDFLEVVGASAQFRFVADGVLFDQQFLGAAEHHLVALERDGVLQFHEARVAFVLLLFGERLRFLVRFRALARAVDEHEGTVELAGFKCLEGRLEIFFGFAHESANHVRRNAVERVLATQLLDNREVLLHVVLAAHLLEHRVGAALDRDVRVVADFRVVQQYVDEFVRVVPRVRARKADAADAADFGNLREEVGKIAAFRLVGVHRLAQERHLGNALVGSLADFGEHVFHVAVFFRPAEVRHDAVAAALVAAALDGDEGAEVVLELRVFAQVVLAQVLVDEHLVVRQVQGALGVAEQQFRDFLVLVRAHDVAHVREALQKFRPAILGHATAHDYLHVGVLLVQVLELADVRDGGFLGLLAYAAGVHDDEVGIFLVARLDATAHVELLGDHRRVVLVHLAAVCGQVVFFHVCKFSKKRGGGVPLAVATAQSAPHANKGSAFGLDCSLSGQAIAVSAATPTAGTPRNALF